MHMSVIDAVRGAGSRNVGTPFEIASTPVSATAPDENARSSMSSDSDAVPAASSCASGLRSESGIGPTIHDVATELPDDVRAASLAGHQTLDTDLFLFRLGPAMHWEMNRRLALSVSMGGAVGFLNGGLKFHDTLEVSDGTTALNSGKVKDSDVSFGGYLNSTLMYHLEEHGDIYISVQYLPMSSFTIEGGGRRAELDMKGSVFFSAGINWPF